MTLTPPHGFELTRSDGLSAMIAGEMRGEVSPARINGWLKALAASGPVAEADGRVGRGSVLVEPLKDSKAAVVRLYRRGGALGKLVTRSFVAFGKPRPFRELEVTERLRAGGLRVPRVLAAAVYSKLSGLVYEGLLVTELVPGAIDLQSLALDPAQHHDNLEHLAELSGREARAVAVRGVLHRDLHPGNVLIASAREIVIIDFDKALEVPAQGLGQALDYLALRWQRAVEKRGLPPVVTAGFKRGLHV